MKCCFCNRDAGKYGNNAQPITEGKCCDYCNSTYVLPERLRRFILYEKLKQLQKRSGIK